MSEAAGETGRDLRVRAGLLVATLAAWWISFALVNRLGTWIPFAIAGPLLVALTLILDPPARRLLRPSGAQVLTGLLGGVAMVLLTHFLFEIAVTWMPFLRSETRTLYEILNVAGFPVAVTAGLITVVATSEEILFRGSLAGALTLGTAAGTTLLLSLIYALSTATSESLLLVVAAFGCGLVWGTMRVVTRGLVAPAICHVVWDLGVLIAWPLI